MDNVFSVSLRQFCLLLDGVFPLQSVCCSLVGGLFVSAQFIREFSLI